MEKCIQPIIMPDLDYCSNQELFFSGDKNNIAEYDYKNKVYRFDEGNEIFANTYFNSFSEIKWKKYTSINCVKLQLCLLGNFEVSIFFAVKTESQLSNRLYLRETINAEQKGVFSFNINYELEQFDGLFYFVLKAKSNDCFFYGGGYYSDADYINEINIAAIFCTYKREKFLYKNIETIKKTALNKESILNDKLHVYVIDNAKTIDNALNKDCNISVIYNKNVGGAGGFTRGIIEAIQSDKNFTHVVLMDDDAVINPYAFTLLFSFLSYVKKPFKKMWIGGSTLRLDQQNIQMEAGAVWNNDLLFNTKRALDLSLDYNLLFNESDESRSYVAWVFNCIPLSTISLDNLPLPVFVRGDDMEYGIRNAGMITTLNGICSWHVPLHNKYSFFMDYYVIRNQLILNAIHDDSFSYKRAKNLLINSIKRELLYYRYESVNLIFRAFEDFLKGIELFEIDGEKLHSEVMKMAPEMKSYSELTQIGKPFIYEKMQYLNNLQAGKLQKIMQVITLNGYLCPGIFFNSKGWDNYRIVDITKPRSIYFFMSKNVLQIDLLSEKGYVSSLKRRKLFTSIVRCIYICTKMRFGALKRAILSYKLGYKKVTSIQFWNKYLNREA